MIQIQHYESPCGELILGSFEGKLCLCDWMFEKRRASIDKRIQKALGADYEEGVSDVIRETIIQLDEYFARQRKTFDIPLVFTGTEFQNSVWQELLDIPYGKRCLMVSWLKSWETRKLFVPWLLPTGLILFPFLFLVIG